VQSGKLITNAEICGLTVTTRDISPFETAGLNVINPWNILAMMAAGATRPPVPPRERPL